MRQTMLKTYHLETDDILKIVGRHIVESTGEELHLFNGKEVDGDVMITIASIDDSDGTLKGLNVKVESVNS